MKKLKEILKDSKKYKITHQPKKRKKNEEIAYDIYITPNFQIEILKNQLIQQNRTEEKLDLEKGIIVPYIRIKKKIKKYSNLKLEKQNYDLNFVKKPISKINSNFIYVKKTVKYKKLNVCHKNKKIINKDIISTNSESNVNNNKNLYNNDEKFINNNRFKIIAKSNGLIKKEDLQKISIEPDGNCFYRSVSYFLLGSQQYYNEIKKEIIDWIEKNKQKFIDFFGDDDVNNITKEEKAEDELNYIKKKNSWGGYHTLEITNILFNLSTVVYVDNGDGNYKKYFYSENSNENAELMILLYENDSHFELLYDKNIVIQNSKLYHSFDNIKVNKYLNTNNIKSEGIKFANTYVQCKFKASSNLYDEISNYLKSIQKYENEIKEKQKDHPLWHINQIISLFNIKYPKRIQGKTSTDEKKRQLFRKEASKYMLDENNRLCVLNPIEGNEEKIYYKIPYLHEKDLLIKQYHINNNHCGRTQIINLLHKDKWYWFGMNNDIRIELKKCIQCTNPNKFIKLKKKNKIILDNGPHYRYVADLWYLNTKIAALTGYKYVLDIIDHFSKWYGGYLLKTKSAEEVLKNIEKYIENFGTPKILQVDNGTEFTNALLDNYCKNNNIKLVHSSPYHPQTNGVCEAVHKEIRKYIYNEFINNEGEFNIEDSLFNITKLHNNKIHSTTKRVPKDIRDISDPEEIELINIEIKKTLDAKNKNYDVIDLNCHYVIDTNKIYEKNGKIYKKTGKIKPKKMSKLPVRVICEIVEGEDYIIEICKNFQNFEVGETYNISLDLLEKVNYALWKGLI